MNLRQMIAFYKAVYTQALQRYPKEEAKRQAIKALRYAVQNWVG